MMCVTGNPIPDTNCTTLSFEFNASESYFDINSIEGLQFLWDFESDGNFDSDGIISIATFKVVAKPANP